MSQRGGTVTLRLSPPELGSLRIDVRFVEGAVQARFQASNVTAGVMLNQNMAALRQALETQGLTVDQLHVHSPASSPSTGAGHAGQHTTQQDAQQSGGDGRSRGYAGARDGDGSSDHSQDSHDQRRRRFEQALLDLVG
jgi:flagellar hook-length control protein FliK